jgi:hypothetical protein
MRLKISIGESIVERFPTTTSIKPSNGELQRRLMDDCHGPSGPTLRNVIQYVPSSTCTGATAHLSKKKKEPRHEPDDGSGIADDRPAIRLGHGAMEMAISSLDGGAVLAEEARRSISGTTGRN